MCRMKTSILITTVLVLLLVVPVLTAQPADLKVSEVEVSLKSLMDKGEPDITEAYVRNHIRIRPGDQFRPGMRLEDAAALAIASINLKTEEKSEIKNVKMAKVSSDSKKFEKVSESDLENYSKNVSKFTNE